MLRHWQYLRYVLKHKWFVFVAGRKLKLSFWRCCVHDLDKFRPNMWFEYARAFYQPNGRPQYVESEGFNKAWLDHICRSGHHWQRYVLLGDDGGVQALPMPASAIREMVADWVGAGMACTVTNNVRSWYRENKTKMKMNALTRTMAEFLIRIADPRPYECVVCGHGLAQVNGACAFCVNDTYKRVLIDEEVGI